MGERQEQDISGIEREAHHRFVKGEEGNALVSTGFNRGLPELETRKVDASQSEYSISYVLKGEGSFEDEGGRRYRFSPGSVVQRYPERKYSIHREERFTHLEFFLILPRPLFESFQASGIIDTERSVFDVGLDTVFTKRLSNFVQQFRTSSDSETRSILMETIPLLIDFLKRDANLARDSDEETLMEKACLLLSDGFESKLKLESVAECLGLSYESFRKKFRQQKGMSPAQYRIQKGMEQAMKLLIEDRLQIKEIAYELGYANTANFAKIFQKTYGQTPSGFRSAYRERIERNR